MTIPHRPFSKSLRAFGYLALYCLISALRDVLWGRYFRFESPQVATSYSLLAGCLVTIVIGLAWQWKDGGSLRLSSQLDFWKSWPGGWFDFALINLSTMGAYYAYLLAVASRLGPGLTSFVDYTLNPLFTALIAVSVLGLRPPRVFLLAMLLGVLGLVVFFAPRLSFASSPAGFDLAAGLGFALVSASLGGLFKVYSKKALDHGLKKIDILVARLGLLTVVLLIHVLILRVPITLGQGLQLFCWGVFGFFLPLILFLSVLEKLTMDSIALLLFSIPVMTYFGSAAFGLQRIFVTDAGAIGLIFLGTYLNERHRRRGRGGAKVF